MIKSGTSYFCSFGKKFRIMLFLFMIIFMFGCSRTPSVVDTIFGEEVTLSVGQSMRVDEDGIKITFEEVIGDSRCPRGVKCVWAGVASIRITLSVHDEKYSLSLNQEGFAENVEFPAAGVVLVCSLEPYPEEGRVISPKDYRLRIKVNK